MNEWHNLLKDDYDTPKEGSKVDFVTSKAAIEDGFFKDGKFCENNIFMGREYINTFKQSEVNDWRYHEPM